MLHATNFHAGFVWPHHATKSHQILNDDVRKRSNRVRIPLDFFVTSEFYSTYTIINELVRRYGGRTSVRRIVLQCMRRTEKLQKDTKNGIRKKCYSYRFIGGKDTCMGYV